MLVISYDLSDQCLFTSKLKLINMKQAERAGASHDVSPSLQKKPISETAKGGHPDQMTSRNNMTTSSPKSSNKFRRRNTQLPTNSFKIKQRRKQLLQTADSNQVRMG